MSRKIDEKYDQTAFAAAAALEEKQDYAEEDDSLSPPQDRRWWIVVLAMLIIVVSSAVIWLLFNSRSADSHLDEVVRQDNFETELSPIERELLLLERDIARADPLQSSLSFPPVNFDLNLEDATLLQQNQR